MEEENKDYDAVGAHLKQWQETAKRIREQFAPIIKYKEVIKKSMQPIFEAQKALQKSLEPVLAEQERWRKLTQSIQIPKIDLPNILHLTKPIIEYQKTIQGFINPAFEQLQKSFKELPSRTKEALLLLGEQKKMGSSLPLTLTDIVLFFPYLIFNFSATFFSLETFWS